MMSRFGNVGGRLYRGEVSVNFVGRKRTWYSISAAIHLLLKGGAEGGTFMSQRNIAVPMAAPDEACPIGEVLDHIAGKWSIGIIVAAAAGPIRFTELERAIEGISRRMLTLNLRKLERDGLLIRTVYPTVPPKVEYRLTPHRP
jgi:DNA-binding HxlR family transcriptional regulator